MKRLIKTSLGWLGYYICANFLVLMVYALAAYIYALSSVSQGGEAGYNLVDTGGGLAVRTNSPAYWDHATSFVLATWWLIPILALVLLLGVHYAPAVKRYWRTA